MADDWEKAKISETIRNEIAISLSKLEKVKRRPVRETCKKEEIYDSSSAASPLRWRPWSTAL